MDDSLSRHDLLRTRVKRFKRMLHGLEGGDVRAVHQARVVSRRLRELLPVLQIESDLSTKLGRRLRRVTRALGPIREADVLLKLIDARIAKAGADDAKALGHVSYEVKAARKRALSRALDKALTTDARKLGKKLDRALKSLEKPSGGQKSRGFRWALEARVSRRAASLRNAMKGAGAVYLAERLHPVRIELKKLRYALELSEEAAGRKASADVKRLKQAQRVLGLLHDNEVLLNRVRQTQATLTPPDVVTWKQVDHVVRALERECRKVHAKYVRERPALDALCQRLGARPPTSARRAG